MKRGRMRCTRMRADLPIALVLVAGHICSGTANARADTGVYVEESFTAVHYGGDLAAYGEGRMRFSFGVSIRQDAWRTDLVGGCVLDEDAIAQRRRGNYCFGGFDLRRTWQANRLHPYRASHAGVRLSLGAGPRYFEGDGAMTGYRGAGASGSARIEGDVWVIGYFLTAGVDLMWMRIPVDNLVGIAPFAGFGGKIGWL
jgi:hypothetical protein